MDTLAGHTEWCATHPTPAEREAQHTSLYKARILLKGKRWYWECSCGVAGNVGYSIKEAAFEGLALHRRHPKL